MGPTPRPLQELEAETCRRLLGIAFDIDDTVTREGRLEVAAFRAMHEISAAGLHLVALTGRPLGWTDVIAHHWPVDVAVGENGAGWTWLDGATPHHGYFEPVELRSGYPDMFARVRGRVAQTMPHVKVSVDQPARRCDLAFDVGETVRLPEDEIEELVALIEAEGARCEVSSVHAHAVPGEWDKARGAERAVREVLGIDITKDRSRWLFIGDSRNDAAAFEYFPISVGVKNVEAYLAQLPTPPPYVTRGDRGVGFAEMAEHVLGARAG